MCLLFQALVHVLCRPCQAPLVAPLLRHQVPLALVLLPLDAPPYRLHDIPLLALGGVPSRAVHADLRPDHEVNSWDRRPVYHTRRYPRASRVHDDVVQALALLDPGRFPLPCDPVRDRPAELVVAAGRHRSRCILLLVLLHLDARWDVVDVGVHVVLRLVHLPRRCVGVVVGHAQRAVVVPLQRCRPPDVVRVQHVQVQAIDVVLDHVLRRGCGLPPDSFASVVVALFAVVVVVVVVVALPLL